MLNTQEGRSVTSVMPAVGLALTVGQSAYAVFEANSVIFAVYA